MGAGKLGLGRVLVKQVAEVEACAACCGGSCVAVAREILTRRPTAKKVAKELDEISEVTQVRRADRLDMPRHHHRDEERLSQEGGSNVGGGGVCLYGIAGRRQVAIRSVRRQYDNLRRAYSYIEEQRSFSAEEQKVGHGTTTRPLGPPSLAWCRAGRRTGQGHAAVSCAVLA